jgi:hypothetical protein
VAREQQRHRLVANLHVAQLRSVLIPGFDQQAEDIGALGVGVSPPLPDLASDDAVEDLARLEQAPPRGPRATQDANPWVGSIPVEGAFEMVGRRGPGVAVVGVESEQRPHCDTHREVARPVVDIDHLARAPARERTVGFGDHRGDGCLDALAVEGGHHDCPRPVVVGVIDREEAVAQEGNEIAEAALAPVEVLGSRDGDEVVRRRPEHEHVAHVEEARGEDRPVLLIVAEEEPQRVAHEVARSQQIEVLRAGRKAAVI